MSAARPAARVREECPSASPALLDTAEMLIAAARKAGADEVEVVVEDGTDFQVEVRRGRIEHLEEAGTRALRIRVIKDKRTAHSSSSDLAPETLKRLVKNAVKRAELATPDEFAGLAPLDRTKIDPAGLELFDPEVPRLEAREKIRLAKETEKLALADKRITNSYGSGFSSGRVDLLIANSNGFCGEYAQTYCSLSLGLQAGTTDDRVEDFWGSSQRFIAELETPEQVARTAVERTVRHLHPRKIRTANVPVIFEPTQTDWLLGFLFGCVAGSAIYQKSSFLAGRLGERIGNELVNVVDDGLIPRAPGTRPFDSDGLASRRTVVVDKGVLRSYLCNTYSARKLGLKSTASASGPGIGPGNFYLLPGESTQEEMISSTGKGLLLTRVIGHGLNSVTGDISRGAFGLWIENGEIAYPVSEITISGKLEPLLKGLTAVGSDLDLSFGPICGPSIKVAEMTVAGE